MTDYIAYDNDGRILWVMPNSFVDETKTAMASQVNVMEGMADDATQYILNGQITNRPNMTLSTDKTSITADGTDKATISGVPAGATASCEGTEITVNDGKIEFTTDIQGAHTISIECFPYLSEEVEINAT